MSTDEHRAATPGNWAKPVGTLNVDQVPARSARTSSRASGSSARSRASGRCGRRPTGSA